MTAPGILLLRASLNVEIAWPGRRWVGDECMDDWVDGFVATRHLSANLMPCFHPLCLSPPPPIASSIPSRAHYYGTRSSPSMESAWVDLTCSWTQAEVGLAGSSLVPSARERIQCRSLQVMFFRPIFFLLSSRYCGTSVTSDT